MTSQGHGFAAVVSNKKANSYYYKKLSTQKKLSTRKLPKAKTNFVNIVFKKVRKVIINHEEYISSKKD